MVGVHGLFSVQLPDPDGTDSERRHGFALIDAARKAGVAHFVHTSVCQVEEHMNFPLWDAGYWAQKYWTDKWDVDQAVRAADFPVWTVLRPTFFMQNFARPKAQRLYPQLRQETLLTPTLQHSRVQLVAAQDVGAFARAAFENPVKFGRRIIGLVSDSLTMAEISQVLGKMLHRTVVTKSVSPEEALDAGILPAWVRAQEWINLVGYHVDTADLSTYGVPLTSFSAWARQHADEIDVEG